MKTSTPPFPDLQTCNEYANQNSLFKFGKQFYMIIIEYASPNQQRIIISTGYAREYLSVEYLF